MANSRLIPLPPTGNPYRPTATNSRRPPIPLRRSLTSHCSSSRISRCNGLCRSLHRNNRNKLHNSLFNSNRHNNKLLRNSLRRNSLHINSLRRNNLRRNNLRRNSLRRSRKPIRRLRNLLRNSLLNLLRHQARLKKKLLTTCRSDFHK